MMHLADIVVIIPEIRGTFKVNKTGLAGIIDSLVSLLPQLGEELFIDRQLGIVKNTILLFHNHELVKERQLANYTATIKEEDEIIVMSTFSEDKFYMIFLAVVSKIYEKVTFEYALAFAVI